MMRWAYSLVTQLAQPWLRRKLARRAASEPLYGHAVAQRFGHYDDLPLPQPEPTPPTDLIWIHAVSLGETRTAALLVKALRERWPGLRLLLTHGTATGWQEGRTLLRQGDVQVWQPWDTPAATRRFVAHFKPRLGLLMETEVWPNLVHACTQAQIPVALVNARMSDKSYRQARRLRWLSQPAFAALAQVWAQTDADAQRLRALGAVNVQTLGNLKFDATPHAQQLAQGRAWAAACPQPVVMLASSREGEEAEFLRILKKNWPLSLANQCDIATYLGVNGESTLPQAVVRHGAQNTVQWMIVPRHPQRFDEVAALIQSHGFTVQRRSQWQDAPADSHDGKPGVWLGDSLGEMALYYGLAQVAMLGGSFEPLGGQNLIEAAACGCPIVMGPHTFNFTQAAEFSQQAGAALRVASLHEGMLAANALAHDSARHHGMRTAAMAFAQGSRGAVDKTVQAVQAVLARCSQGQKPQHFTGVQ